MRKLALIVLLVLVMGNIASATIVRGIDMDFVTIGNAGNAPDTTGFGAVDYDYRIGKYEITNAQWNAFTSASGLPTGNLGDAYDESASHIGMQQPTNYVSWYETLQFCNYLTSGDKSKGVYQFSGNNTNPGDFIGIDRSAAEDIYGITYFLPTEDEWYKAAYHTGSGYSLYANGTSTAPSTSEASYDIYSSPWDVGTGTQEQNDTFDMMGNVWEWIESPSYGSNRILRGGSYYAFPHVSHLASTYRNINNPDYGEIYDIGFRVASVPEPTTLLLLGLGFGFIRKRRENVSQSDEI